MKITHALELPAEAGTVPVVRALVRASMLGLGIDQACVDDIVLALTEACANVVAHAAADDARDGSGSYHVEIRFDRSTCQIEVTDHGGGFDASDMRVGMPNGQAERGRGLAIIEALMDHVTFSSEPGRGTVVTFEKRLVLDPDSKLQPFASPT